MTQSLAKPLLSICVPSRNRQIYFQETIRSLLVNKRPDVEFIFTDNSDDPSIMAQFLADLPQDPRVVFLPSGSRTFSMIENWERTVAVSSGQWVTVIGDDDYIDPDVALVLSRVLRQLPDLEAFEWQRLSYAWPNPGKEKPTNVDVGLSQRVYAISKQTMLRRAFQWQEAETAPKGGFSIYHAAIARSLIDRIKARNNGKLFGHPVVDFDSAFRVAWLGERFAVCQRPLSVLGACPQSNSAGLHDLPEMRKRHQSFMDELGRSIDDDPAVKDFPFSSILGVTAIVMQVQMALKAEQGLTFSGWEENFIKSCVRNCEEFQDREAFEIVTAGYRAAISAFRNGRYLKDFAPAFNEAAARATEVYSGFKDGKVYLSVPLLDVGTPAELYSVVDALLPTADEFDATVANPAVR